MAIGSCAISAAPPPANWEDARDALADWPESADLHSQDDVLADWAHIAIDDADNIHLTWHGTANSHIFANDQSYYARRAIGRSGDWPDGWSRPILLMPMDKAAGVKFSFAPSTATDGTLILPVTFFDIYEGSNWRGFDSAFRVIRDGSLDGDAVPVTHYIRDAMGAGRPELAFGARFPSAAPSLYHAPDGRIWLDVLETLLPFGVSDAPKQIVIRRSMSPIWSIGRRRFRPAAQPAEITIGEICATG